MATQTVTYTSSPIYRRTNYRYDGSGNPRPYGEYYVNGTAISVPAYITSWTYSLTFEYVDSESGSSASVVLTGTGGDGKVLFTDHSCVNANDSNMKWVDDPPVNPSYGTRYLAIPAGYIDDVPETDATVSGSITFNYGSTTSKTIYFNVNRRHYISRVVGQTSTSGTNKLRIGDGGVSDVYIGSSRVQKIYVGSTLVYSVGGSAPKFGFILQDENYTVIGNSSQVWLNDVKLNGNPQQVGTTTLTIDMEQGTFIDPGAVPVYASVIDDELYVSLDTTIYTTDGASAYISWNWSGTAYITE